MPREAELPEGWKKISDAEWGALGMEVDDEEGVATLSLPKRPLTLPESENFTETCHDTLLGHTWKVNYNSLYIATRVCTQYGRNANDPYVYAMLGLGFVDNHETMPLPLPCIGRHNTHVTLVRSLEVSRTLAADIERALGSSYNRLLAGHSDTASFQFDLEPCLDNPVVYFIKESPHGLYPILVELRNATFTVLLRHGAGLGSICLPRFHAYFG